MKKLISIFVMLATILVDIHSFASPEESKPLIILSKSNTLVLSEEINFETTAKLIVEARKLDKSDPIDALFGTSSAKPIYLFLNTPGGDVQAGLELAQVLNALQRPVNTITLFSASMGFQLAQQLQEREIMQHSKMMSHQARGGFEGSFGGQSPNQMDNRYRIWLQTVKEMDEQTVKRTNGKQTYESYTKAYDHELWVTGQEAVKQGYADKIVQVRCDSTLDGTEERQIDFLGIKISFEIDKCPINTGILNAKMYIKTNKGVKDTVVFSNEGGSYGADCLALAAVDDSKLCALDTTLTPQKLVEVRSKFIDQIELNKSRIVPIQP